MEHHASAIPTEVLAFLAAAVFSPLIFKRIGLGSIVGYLIVGVLLGPSVLAIFNDPAKVLHLAEFGVVLLLFVIGLELEPSRLLTMRRDIVILGFGQVLATMAALGGLAWLAWIAGTPSLSTFVIIGFAFALSSTAIAINLLNQRGALTLPYGQRSFSVLLAQDLIIVPALALIPALGAKAGVAADWTTIAFKVGLAIACITTIILAGRFVINPILRAIARSGSHDIMVPAALLLVIGAAFVAEAGGLSMALGAFLAGLLLSESSYKHELELNIEPFRSILLALFFMGVGMTLDVSATFTNIHLLLAALIGIFATKMAVITALTRIGGSPTPDALRIATLLAPSSEFAFVLLPLAARHGLMNSDVANGLAAVGVLSMMIGPPFAGFMERILKRQATATGATTDHEESNEATNGPTIMIGFGRFGQTAIEMLRARGIKTTTIDTDPKHLRSAKRYGNVYYGDGTNLKTLRAAGAETARMIMICVEDPQVSLKIAKLVKANFPLALLHVRSYDRAHSINLQELNVNFEIQELYESSMIYGRAALEALGLDHQTALDVEADVRYRDHERFAVQRSSDIIQGNSLPHQAELLPTPLTPSEEGEALNAETQAILNEADQSDRKEPALQEADENGNFRIIPKTKSKEPPLPAGSAAEDHIRN